MFSLKSYKASFSIFVLLYEIKEAIPCEDIPVIYVEIYQVWKTLIEFWIEFIEPSRINLISAKKLCQPKLSSYPLIWMANSVKELPFSRIIEAKSFISSLEMAIPLKEIKINQILKMYYSKPNLSSVRFLKLLKIAETIEGMFLNEEQLLIIKIR